MKTNIILIIVIIILVIGGIVFFGNNTEQSIEVEEIKSVSVLTSDEQLYDFGEIDIFGGLVTTDFTLTNEGPGSIIITAGTTSCGCTNAEIEGISFGMHEEIGEELVLLEGETKNLTVIYDPLAHGPSGTGLIQRSVFLKTNSSVTSELEVRIKALVVNNK